MSVLTLKVYEDVVTTELIFNTNVLRRKLTG